MRREPPVDITDVFGAEWAAERLAERLAHIDRDSVRRAADGSSELFPGLSLARDRFDGPPWARAAIVVFGGFGASASRPLGPILAALKERHPNTVYVSWRHHPDPRDLERSALFALAAEAAAVRGHFWPLTRELLPLRHFDPVDLHRALLRAGLDPERTGDASGHGRRPDRRRRRECAGERRRLSTRPVRERRALPRRPRARGRPRRARGHHRPGMSAAGLYREPVRDPRPRELAAFISIRTILLVGSRSPSRGRCRRSGTSCC
jgi:hypothetical protein